MSKKKPIRTIKQNGSKPVQTATPNSNDKIALTPDNAPIFAAKFLESILFEMRVMNQEIKQLRAKIDKWPT